MINRVDSRKTAQEKQKREHDRREKERKKKRKEKFKEEELLQLLYKDLHNLAHIVLFLVLVHPTRTRMRSHCVVACEEMEEAKKLTWEQKDERVRSSE